MIEQQVTYGARPKCGRCGWVGDWSRSVRSQAVADGRALDALDEHEAFWHEGGPL